MIKELNAAIGRHSESAARACCDSNDSDTRQRGGIQPRRMRAGGDELLLQPPHLPAIDEPARHCATELKVTHYSPHTPRNNKTISALLA